MLHCFSIWNIVTKLQSILYGVSAAKIPILHSLEINFVNIITNNNSISFEITACYPLNTVH